MSASSRTGLTRRVSSFIHRNTAFLWNCLGNLCWGPALRIAKPTILSIFSGIKAGTLVVVDESDGSHRYVFGQKSVLSNLDNQPPDYDTNKACAVTAAPYVELVVKSEAFWLRLFLFADLGFAEAYMLKEVECSELTSFFRLFIANRGHMGNATTWMSTISTTMAKIARSTNTLTNALLNVSAHYDLSNDLFSAFLSPDMTYSCPIWKTAAEGKGTESLEDAQMTKLRRFVDGARIKATDLVLEIGTGWGSFAIEAVRMTGCRVTTITLSKEQKTLAEARIAEAGLSDRIEVLLMDYRALPARRITYDKIVSIEMIEHIGEEYLGTYFACIHRLLKKDGGIAMFQSSTMPEGRIRSYSKSKEFINSYIFPGAYLPSITQIIDHISAESQGTLIVDRIENNGGHYVKTLRSWRDSFSTNFQSQIRPALKDKHKNITEAEAEIFRRKWEYYFSYCEAGFAMKTLGVALIIVGREGALELLERIPL